MKETAVFEARSGFRPPFDYKTQENAKSLIFYGMIFVFKIPEKHKTNE